MPSSRLDSHQNSVQNGMVERFTAFMATIFVPNFNFYAPATFCPLDGNGKKEQKNEKLRKAGQAWQDARSATASKGSDRRQLLNEGANLKAQPWQGTKSA